MSLLPSSDRQEAIFDAQQAEALIKAAIETCETLRPRLEGTEAGMVTKLKQALRRALDHTGSTLDYLDPKRVARRDR